MTDKEQEVYDLILKCEELDIDNSRPMREFKIISDDKVEELLSLSLKAVIRQLQDISDTTKYHNPRFSFRKTYDTTSISIVGTGWIDNDEYIELLNKRIKNHFRKEKQKEKRYQQYLELQKEFKGK